MNFDEDIELFISDLPNKVEHAKRQLLTGNLNAIEFWHRRIGDFLNVLYVLCRRFEEIRSDAALIASFDDLVAETPELHLRLENAILHADMLNDERFACSGNYLPSTGGRPKLQITKEELEHYFEI